MNTKKMSPQDKVKYILEKLPETNDELNPDNTLLIIAYWYLFDEVGITADQFDLMVEKATPPETISRIKRKLRLDMKVDKIKQEVKENVKIMLEGIKQKEGELIEPTRET